MTGLSVIQSSRNDSLSGFEVLQRETCRFTAKEWDEETKLYYMSARYQNPMTSRWMSADPAGPALVNPKSTGFSIIQSMNWYSYTSNNPIKYRDPTGMVEAEGTLGAGPDPVPPPPPPSFGSPDAQVSQEAAKKQFAPIVKAEELLGLPYGASAYGAEKGSQKVEENPEKADCTELLAYGNDSEIFRSWEIGDNPDYESTDTPRPGDMKVWRATDPDTEKTTGHSAFLTGESGQRAILHADPKGVRYSSDYLEGYYKREGFTNITQLSQLILPYKSSQRIRQRSYKHV